MINSGTLKSDAAFMFGKRVFSSYTAALDWAIFGTLLLLITLSAFPTAAVDQPRDRVFEIAILILGGCWIVSVIPSRRWRFHSAVRPIVGLVLLACLQMLPTWFVSIDPIETRQFAI